MKWIFAWNDFALERYGDMIRVAVQSARQSTTLEMHCLHDGKPSAFTRWLEHQGVCVHPARFRFAAQWEQIAAKRDNAGIHRIANGAFLRLEIPSLSQTWNWSDEFVFYSDVDVLFLRDPTPILETLQPRFFAVAPELWRHNFLHMNSGAMLLNLPTLRAQEAKFFAFVEEFLETSMAASWDQGVLRAYFDPLHRAAWRARVPDKLFYRALKMLPFSTHQWNKLPLELNWKPYWGQNSQACVVHFHGVKPWHRAQIEREGVPDALRAVYGTETLAWCAKWERWRDELEPLVDEEVGS